MIVFRLPRACCPVRCRPKCNLCRKMRLIESEQVRVFNVSQTCREMSKGSLVGRAGKLATEDSLCEAPPLIPLWKGSFTWILAAP